MPEFDAVFAADPAGPESAAGRDLECLLLGQCEGRLFALSKPAWRNAIAEKQSQSGAERALLWRGGPFRTDALIA